MRSTITLFILACTCLRVSSSGVSCVDKNPLIKSLRKKNVTVFDSPQVPVDSICQFEWKGHRTCCEIGSLQRYTHQDAVDIKRAVKNVTEMMYLISRDFRSTVRLASTLRSNNLTMSPLLAAYEKSYWSDEMLQFRLVQQTIVNNFSNVTNSSANICWEYLAKLRSASVCSVCSGRNKVFFSSNKALVDIQTCQGMMDHCEDHFDTLVRFIKRGSELIESIYKEIASAKSGFSKEAVHLIQVVKDNLVVLGQYPMIKHLKHYITTHNSTQKMTGLVRVCKILQNLVLDTFIEKIQTPMAQLLESSGLIHNLMGRYLLKAINNQTGDNIDQETAERLKGFNPNDQKKLSELDILYKEHKKRIRITWSHLYALSSAPVTRRLQFSNFQVSSSLEKLFQGDVFPIQSRVVQTDMSIVANELYLPPGKQVMNLNYLMPIF